MDFSNGHQMVIRNRKTVFLYASVLTALLVGSVFLCGCASRPSPFKASMEPSPGWRIGLDCGYEVCQTVQALFTEHLVIRLEPVVDTSENLFYIQISFVSYDPVGIDYDPSTTYVSLHDARIHPKIRECDTTPHVVGHFKEALRQADGLTGIQPLEFESLTCFVLFLDVVPPSKNDVFKLDIGHLIRHGTTVTVPQVSFYVLHFY